MTVDLHRFRARASNTRTIPEMNRHPAAQPMLDARVEFMPHFSNPKRNLDPERIEGLEKGVEIHRHGPRRQSCKEADRGAEGFEQFSISNY